MHWSSRVQDHLEMSCIHCALNPLFLQGEGPILEYADFILQDDFFDRMEIAHIADPSLRRQLATRADRCRVKRTFLAQPTVFTQRLDPGSADHAERERAVRILKECLEEAAELGADMMTFCSGPAVETADSATLCYYAESIEELHAKAAELRIPIVLEPFDDYLDKRRFIGATDKVVALLERLPVSLDMFAVMVDLSHIPLLSEDIRETVRKLGPYLKHAHIGNGVTDRRDARFGDSHPYFGYPGGRNDTGEVAEFLSALIEAGYIGPDRKGAIGIEVIPAGEERVQDVLAGAKRTVRDAWSIAARTANRDSLQAGGRTL